MSPVEAGVEARLEDRFAAALEEKVRRPLIQALERYGTSLHAIVDDMAELAPRTLSDSPPADGGARARYDYAGRFADAFHAQLLDPADRSRAVFFERLAAIPETPIDLPETFTPEADGSDASSGPESGRPGSAEGEPAPPASAAPERAPPPSAPPDRILRPPLKQRLAATLRRSTDRTVPAGPLARFYLARLAERLDPAASIAASLDSVALAAIRRQLHQHADPPRAATPLLPSPDEDFAPDENGATIGRAAIDAGINAVVREIDGAVREVRDGFARAVAAKAIHVPENAAWDALERATMKRERLLMDWQSFEDALYANTCSEAALARALASLEASSARAARELDEALDRWARQPLDRMATRLSALARTAEDRLAEDSVRSLNTADHGGPADAVEALRRDAAELFDAELPSLTTDLRGELSAITAAYVEALDRIAEGVPEDLTISEERIHGVPDRPVKLALRDAPVGELLSTVCRGALPRWIERAMAGTEDELEVLRQELARVRNAVDFHIRAPLRGTLDNAEAAELIVGIMDRAASQLEDLRETGLDAVERIITDLERRSEEEARAVRSAVTEREFLRIRSDIAEEQAVRRISTSVVWVRRLVEAGLRLSRRGWSAGRRTYDLTQDWAEQRLGVGDVEREEMLESVEESLLGEEQRPFQLPGLYRQLFDVEGEVPWEELLVPRAGELSRLQHARERWQRGQSGSVAVVGEKGSGKSTLIRMAEEQLPGDTPIRRLELESTVRGPEELAGLLSAAFDVEARDWEELTAAIRARGPVIAVVEDAHQMFTRTLGGFTVMEAFLELVAATRQDVFWVITMDEYAWLYLDRVVGISLHFTHTISTTNLSPEQLERAVMARHEVSGFSLRFEVEEEEGVRPKRWWRRLRSKETQGELTRRELERRAFFRELNQIAEGNIFLALFYWLRSVDRVEDHLLVLRRPEIINLTFIERLPLPSLHSIAAIILHGSLSEREHRDIFQLDPAENRLHLAALTDAHLIFRSRDHEYRVNKVLYRPLTRLLRTRNIF